MIQDILWFEDIVTSLKLFLFIEVMSDGVKQRPKLLKVFYLENLFNLKNKVFSQNLFRK